MIYAISLSTLILGFALGWHVKAYLVRRARDGMAFALSPVIEGRRG